jgi:hypothetical protein
MMKALFLAVTILCSFFLINHPRAYAYDVFKGADCKDVNQSTSTICNSKTTQNPIVGDNGLLIKISKIIAFVAGAAAVIVIIVGSLQYITAVGDPANAKNARNSILYALIGLIVIVLAESLIVFVVRKL